MYLSVLLLVVVVVVQVTCQNDLDSPEDEKESKNVKKLQNTFLRNGGVVFCNIGCVLYDPNHPPLIDDPGRNFYDTFSVISADYVIEVVGGSYDLSGLRVMMSDKFLGSTHSSKSARLQLTGKHRETLVLAEADVIQRTTFDFHTNFEIRLDSTTPEEFVVMIPYVVPHVVFVHGYKLDVGGRRVDGVVTVEACNLPMTLEVVVGRLEDGRCWMKPLDRKKFEDYMIGLRVRGNDSHVIGMIFTAVQTHLEDGFPFGVYMEEVNEFVFRFLEESLLQTRNVIRENKIYIELCKTISRDPQKAKPATEMPPDFDGDSDPIVFSIDITS